MSEILSQEEVDSLLDGLDSGEIETEKDVEKTETQVMQINTFIGDLIQTKSTNDHETNDNRVVPRTICLLTKVFSKKNDISNISIDNISPEGCHLKFQGDLCPGDDIDLEFYLPDDTRKLKPMAL